MPKTNGTPSRAPSAPFDLSQVKNRIIERRMMLPGELLDHPGQWRDHSGAQANALAGILQEIGITDTLKAWYSERAGGKLVTWDGHLRKSLDPRVRWPVDITDLTDEEADYALATHDPVGAMARANQLQLDSLLSSVVSGNQAVQEMLADLAQEAGLYLDREEQPDAPEPRTDEAAQLQKTWDTKVGQMWAAGTQRLVIGDCADPQVLGHLLGGVKADVVFSDPPYNHASEDELYGADVSPSLQALKDASWDQDFDLQPALDAILGVLAPDATVYVCSSHHLAPVIWAWMSTWADHFSWCIWHKTNPMPSLAKRHWTWDAELIPYATRGKHTFNFPVAGHAPCVWDLPKAKATQHPTEKPVALVEHALAHSSLPGMTVLDGFLGSGTTLVACARLDRRGFGVELDPAWAAVTLDRLARLGATPRLVEG